MMASDVTETVTPGSGFPSGSVMMPLIVPVCCWAKTDEERKAKRKEKNKILKILLFKHALLFSFNHFSPPIGRKTLPLSIERGNLYPQIFFPCLLPPL